MCDMRNKTAGIVAGNNDFSFGAQMPSTVKTSFTGFSFGSPTNSAVTSTPSGGNNEFSFASLTPACRIFPFGAPKTSSATTGGGFSFGTRKPSVGNSTFKIGSSTLTSPSVVNSPNVGITTSQISANAFSFGNPTNSTVTSIPSGGNSGFPFASSPPAFSTFPYGAPKTTAATTRGGFSFGTPIPAVDSTAFKMGTSTLAAPSVVNSPSPHNVGITTSQATANVFNFGNPIYSTDTSTTSGGNSGFPFASSPPAFSTFPFGAPKTTAATTSGSFSFGTPTPAVSSIAFKMGTSTLAAPSVVNSPSPHNVGITTSQATANGFNFGNPTISAVTSVTSAGSSAFSLSSPVPAFSSFPFGVPKTTAATTGGGFSFGTATPAIGNTGFKIGTSTSATPSVAYPSPPFNVGISTTQATANAFAPSSAAGSFTMASNILPSTIQSTGGKSAGFLPDLFVGQPAKIPASSVAVVPPVTTQIVPANSAFSISTAVTGTVPNLTSIVPGFALSAPSTLTPTTMPTASAGFKAPSTFAPSAITTASTAFGAPSTLATTTITTASTGFGAPSLLPTPAFAGIKSSTSASSAPFMATASTSFPSSGSSAFSFGAVTTTVPTTSTSLPATALAVMTTTTTVAQASAAPTTTINFRQLQDTINKWKIELEEQERVFLNQATQVNAWDRLLISNGEKIIILNEAVDRIKLDQQQLDHELDFILAQQRELKELLIPLEKSVESTPGISVQQHANLEREHTYHLAENIDAQMKRMAEDIKEIIEHLNAANKTHDDNDPMQQIAKILNAHMDALQWVDQSTAALQRKMDDTSKLYEIQRRDQEKSFRIRY